MQPVFRPVTRFSDPAISFDTRRNTGRAATALVWVAAGLTLTLILANEAGIRILAVEGPGSSMPSDAVSPGLRDSILCQPCIPT